MKDICTFKEGLAISGQSAFCPVSQLDSDSVLYWELGQSIHLLGTELIIVYLGTGGSKISCMGTKLRWFQ